MPIISIHEEVAIRLAENNNKLDTKDFYLGVCAPDTVNLNGFAEKEKRWTSHQRKKDLNEWRNSLKEFYQKEKSNYPKNFLLGYITHILTDIIYDDYFYDDVKKQIINDNNSNNDPHELMGKDMEYYFNGRVAVKDFLTGEEMSVKYKNGRTYIDLTLNSWGIVCFKRNVARTLQHFSLICTKRFSFIILQFLDFASIQKQ